jgi:hypothetical protein
MRIRHKRTDLRRFKRQKCSVCHCEDKFNYYVPDELWCEIVPPANHRKVVCLPCFDAFARRQGIDYADSIETLYFAGDQASFKFQTVSAQDV